MEPTYSPEVSNLLHDFLNTNHTFNITLDNTVTPICVSIPITVVYTIIFLTGVVGNVSTCVVIASNKSMHTATNYYLFSLAISDMLLLVSGLPPEMYRIWAPESYVFGEAFCILQSFAAETSANATVLTITAFTVERYLAICHPFLTHTMSKLSRVVRYIVAIWVVALCLAAPQAMQFGIEVGSKNGVDVYSCTVVSKESFEHAFEISTFLFFVGPMTLITVLYILIAVQLRRSARKRGSTNGGGACDGRDFRMSRNVTAQNRVIRMLVAVVVAFFICWAPFHAQRLLAVYLSEASAEDQQTSATLYMILNYTSGVLYFLSTTINPLLYHIMSNKFREAFKNTLADLCSSNPRTHMTRSFSAVSTRTAPSVRRIQRSASEALRIATPPKDPVTSGHIELPNFKKPSPRRPVIVPENRRSRMFSETSQTTVLTALSVVAVKSARKKGDEEGNGSLAAKLMEMFRRPVKMGAGRRTVRDGSLDSGHTISNSSLQDMEDIDFSSSDLVKYMEEVNEDIT